MFLTKHSILVSLITGLKRTIGVMTLYCLLEFFSSHRNQLQKFSYVHRARTVWMDTVNCKTCIFADNTFSWQALLSNRVFSIQFGRVLYRRLDLLVILPKQTIVKDLVLDDLPVVFPQSVPFPNDSCHSQVPSDRVVTSVPNFVAIFLTNSAKCSFAFRLFNLTVITGNNEERLHVYCLWESLCYCVSLWLLFEEEASFRLTPNFKMCCLYMFRHTLQNYFNSQRKFSQLQFGRYSQSLQCST